MDEDLTINAACQNGLCSDCQMMILYITGDDIVSPACGCALRSAFLYQALKQYGEVMVFNPKGVGEGALIRRLFAVPFRKLTKVGRWPFRRRLPQLGGRRWDAVVIRYLSTAAEVAAWQYGPCYVDIDDLPTKAFASVEGRRLPRWMRPFCAWLVKVWQNYCIRKCAGVWLSNEDDIPLVKGFVRGKVGHLRNIARKPNPNYKVNGKQDRILMTVGLMGYVPNAEGVDWFLENIWAEVHKRWPDLTYVIAGGGASAEKMAAWSNCPNVKPLGYVENLDGLYERALAVVAPILSGAGTSIKVIEALSHGRVVFATREALRGYSSVTGALIFCSAREFANNLMTWLDMPKDERADAQNRIGLQAMKFSFNKFHVDVASVLL